MTRMAPRPTRVAFTEPAIRSASFRWRVGLRGSLAVSLSAAPIDGALQGTVELADGLACGVVATILCSGRTNQCDLETVLEIVLHADAGDRTTSITVLHPTMRSNRDLILLTDLPAVMGLRGGTYALEQVLVD